MKKHTLFKNFLQNFLKVITIFFIFFSFLNSKDVFAAPPVCTAKMIENGKEVSSTVVVCPTIGTFKFLDDKCYERRFSRDPISNTVVEGAWTLALCPGQSTENQKQIPDITNRYSYISTQDTVTITGTIDPIKNPDYLNYIVYFQWAPTPIAGVNNPNAKSHEDFTDTSPAKILASKVTNVGIYGSYTITLQNITPNVKYNIREIIINPSNMVSLTGPEFVRDTNITSTGGVGGQVKENFDEVADFEKRSYRLLAPFPGMTVLMDPDLCAEQEAIGNSGNICDINDFLNFALMLLIGLGAALLVVRIMIAGFQYATSDVISIKISTKQTILDAALGLLLTLTAFIILNTINPKIVENVIDIKRIEIGIEVIKLPDAGDSNIDPDFKKGGSSYSKDASISPEVLKIQEKIKEGWEINALRVYPNNRMLISLKKDGKLDNSHLINVESGLSGFSEKGTGVTKDNKTPMGTWKIIGIRTPKTKDGSVYNSRGSNMGAAFFHLNPTNNGERGIGIHGNKNGTLTKTEGCIRMKNADIEALLPYLKIGTQVIIG